MCPDIRELIWGGDAERLHLFHGVFPRVVMIASTTAAAGRRVAGEMRLMVMIVLVLMMVIRAVRATARLSVHCEDWSLVNNSSCEA